MKTTTERNNEVTANSIGENGGVDRGVALTGGGTIVRENLKEDFQRRNRNLRAWNGDVRSGGLGNGGLRKGKIHDAPRRNMVFGSKG